MKFSFGRNKCESVNLECVNLLKMKLDAYKQVTIQTLCKHIGIRLKRFIKNIISLEKLRRFVYLSVFTLIQKLIFVTFVVL